MNNHYRTSPNLSVVTMTPKLIDDVTVTCDVFNELANPEKFSS